jgi:hypothetical protein
MPIGVTVKGLTSIGEAKRFDGIWSVGMIR